MAAAEDLQNLSIEDLGNIEISSVSKKVEPLNAAPAAIYVITNEDIRRSGATGIPEMLRLAPNLQVAQSSARLYSVAARGFGTANPNKLLVLIDGRTVYSPLHSAVFWDSQDVMPEDIDRIEVISGPGGTLWGANAVNGVINITSRNTADTQGGVVSFGGGPEEYGGRARYGGRAGDHVTYRVYAKGFERNNNVTFAGADAGDDWDKVQGGFRIDWDADDDLITMQGDIYDGNIKAGNASLYGHNLLTRWDHRFSAGSALTVQAYYDKTDRQVPVSIGDQVETYDIEARHNFSLGTWNDVVWGGGYRLADGVFSNVPALFVLPARRKIKLANGFVQDKISITDDLKLTVGVKLEHSSYSGSEWLPSARLAWQFSQNMMLWSAVSRAVRTPARVDRELFAPPTLTGNPNFVPEKLIAYEAGYRGQFFDRASLSISGFYNVYDDLRSLELTPPGRLPVFPANGIEGNTYGVEVWGNFGVTDWWLLSGGFSLLRKDLRVKPGSLDITGVQALGNDPGEQYTVRSNINFAEDFEFDLNFRAVSRRPTPAVPSYVMMDARLGWNPSEHIELSITGSNLLDGYHPEFGAMPGRSELHRTFYVSALWKW